MASKVIKKTDSSEYDHKQLFTRKGKRKYLDEHELDLFIRKAQSVENPKVRTLCLVMAQTGCRISEALELTAKDIDISSGSITFRTLKQKKKLRYRSVPVPDSTLDALELVHGIRKASRSRKAPPRLWDWQRIQAYNHIKAVMKEAGITGEHASPKGLRHGFGVRAIQKTRNPRLVQKWLGHTTLEMTTIYMDVIGQEEREEVRRMWKTQ